VRERVLDEDDADDLEQRRPPQRRRGDPKCDERECDRSPGRACSRLKPDATLSVSVPLVPPTDHGRKEALKGSPTRGNRLDSNVQRLGSRKGSKRSKSSLRDRAQNNANGSQARMNSAIARRSSSIVVSVEQACHAGGRGFESRRSRLLKPLQNTVLRCLPRHELRF
jgi:hypothetical protein